MADNQTTKQPVENEPKSSVRQLTYKIAFPTANGETITPHFGRAKYFLVVEIQGKKVVSKQLRENRSHEGMPEHHGHEHNHEHGHHHEHHHEHDPEKEKQQHAAHGKLMGLLDDVDIIFAAQMGPRAYDDFTARGYTVILTDIRSIDQALEAYLDGKLKIS